MVKIPFGNYSDFQDCLNKNKDKSDAAAYCASVHKKITGKWPSEKEAKKINPFTEYLKKVGRI